MVSKDSCILITSSSENHAKKIAIDTYQTMKSRGFNVLLDQYLSKEVKGIDQVCQDDKLDFIFVFGGDGTILKTFAKWKNTPILGVNCGRVGFLSETDPSRINEAIEKIGKNEYFIEKNSAIAVFTKAYSTISAANDVFVTSDKIGLMIRLKVEVNDKYLYSLHGDGLIISSRIGSSAYSLSAGGALLMPGVDAFSLVPICPFSKRIVPMVIPFDAKITVTNLSKYRAGKVVVDGQSYYSIGYNETISIAKAEDQINFVRFSDNYVLRVREKLLRYNPDDFDE